MKTNETTRELVKRKYGEIADQARDPQAAGCCGTTGCGDGYTNLMSDDYGKLEGYNPEADLGLGCGLPTEFARIQPGNVVVDLGSGAGNDAFVARHATGAAGRVIGIDFTPSMIERARLNAQHRGFDNVEFIEADITELPLEPRSVDVVVSNCVLNLVPEKEKVFREIFRVLKAAAHFSISDIVLEGDLPEGLAKAAEMYSGCVSGAIQHQEYLELIRKAGFTNIEVQKNKPIHLPDSLLLQYLQADELESFRLSGTGVRSITVYAEKPACCGSDCC